MSDLQFKRLMAVALACSFTFGLGLVLGWLEGVRLDRLVLLALLWGALLAIFVWLCWRQRRPR